MLAATLFSLYVALSSFPSWVGANPHPDVVQRRDLGSSKKDIFKIVKQALGSAKPDDDADAGNEDEGGFKEGLESPMSEHANSNPDPPKPVYPRVARCDAPYSFSEEDLRSAIYIPDTFTRGDKPPVLLVPGTASTGYISFAGNFIPLLTDVSWADPVWVNPPGMMLTDAQGSSEYIAYAINYVASLTQKNVSIIAWSQGTLNVQWAFKYWPSTRKVVSNHVALSADFKGTIFANFIDVTGLSDAPAVVQQEANSKFVKTLQTEGGDSAYVPTTSIYSAFFDEVVQPQKGDKASAFIEDVRGVGVTNAELQAVCPGKPAGGLYTHESTLVNPLTFALAKDAITNGGPAQLERLNLDEICEQHVTPGLRASDVLITEASILLAAKAVLKYSPKSPDEPPIKPYTESRGKGCSSGL
ncbi:hypothetical protein HIM_08109 [Hirsutella minnesotensis 3608]|uniref:Lipase B n=1 Tax=Hirsutella minnesotensis 3608 TaxID=1043627 RepID=A0A0F7ZMR1_9HYPO|nr:hypothetical protein HIM_08109 [Hirsutella minnesotensis 3608]